MATIEDVAARAGVSIGTVSNVLNRPQAVAPATRARVQAAITALGYVPHAAARALVAGRSRTIGLIVPEVTNPFFADLARGAEEVADDRDLTVMLYNSNKAPGRELRFLGQLESQRVQGILLTPVNQVAEALSDVVARGTPVVLLDRGSGHRNLCSVAVDDRVGGELAATHLVERGHRHLAFVGGPFTVHQVAERLAGARSVTDAAGARLEVIETTGLTVAAARAAATGLARRPAADRPTAVFCANDLLALGVLQTVTRERLRVPGDLAIVGYDDIAFAAAAAVPLTSVRQPRQQLGRVAAQLLFEEIDDPGRHGHRQVVFQPELIARASTRVTAPAS
ncbi:LacI family transcriptional regulator [Actinoplanes cyaneus]|uniref:LacI family transcriptional regulator n=1 Tax=Actinoplanes cyaneus TaxID=52696 RepID=A0A919M7C8_9ACTN|nr:LacI family DNA-binding transcriptional regulator [Actinoplanes cyaneus]MCW2141131.1 transcriptional regulator, LacI family [Actinoplanes cyaneus]GID67193.1 LacI family transcriptional regulator [Actinoplanes cyaneus]